MGVELRVGSGKIAVVGGRMGDLVGIKIVFNTFSMLSQRLNRYYGYSGLLVMVTILVYI